MRRHGREFPRATRRENAQATANMAGACDRDANRRSNFTDDEPRRRRHADERLVDEWRIAGFSSECFVFQQFRGTGA